MANILFDLVDPVELTNYARQYDIEVARPDARLELAIYLPDQPQQDLDYRVRKGTLNDVDAAVYRAWDTPPPMTGRQGVSFMRGSLAPVSRQIAITEEESLRQEALDRQTDDPLIEAIYNDVELMVRSVAVRVELARGDVIDDGAVTINENGLTLEADFGRRAAFSKVEAVFWTNAAAPILTNLLTYVEEYTDVNGVEPGELLMSRARLGNLALNTEMRSYAAANGVVPTRLNAATISEIFAAEGLPPLRIYDTQVRVNGVRTRVLPQNKVYLMPPQGDPLGATLFGPTAEALFLRERGVIEREEAPGLIAVVLQNQNPVQTFTLATATPLPAMPNPDLVMDLQVAA